MYRGDFKAGVTLDFKFTTVSGDGLPTALSASPALSVYKANSATQSTAGITLTVDFDGVTGLNHVRIALTDAFYVKESDYQVVITAGEVDGKSVVGYVVGEFSIENRTAAIAAAHVLNKTEFNQVTGQKKVYKTDGSTVLVTRQLASSGDPVGSTVTETPV